MQQPKRQCLIYAAVAVVLGLGWQTALVYNLYGGNWTALFYHGYGPGLPNDPVFAGTYIFPDDLGFDGQYYRIVAHDPFLRRGWARHIDLPAMRYRRILVPVLAYLLAFGRQRYVDAGFFAAILLFLFLGVYWLGRYAVLYGRSAKWGWAFLLAPGTLAGLERGSIDTALAALTIGFVLYLREQSRYRLLLVLMLAGLCRDTGVLLILACAGSALLYRNWPRLVLSSVSALPALAWFAYVWMRTPAEPSLNLIRLPLTDLVTNVIHHNPDYIKNGFYVVQFAYYMAVLGILLAFVLSFLCFFACWKCAEALVLVAFTLFGLLVQTPGLWAQPYYFGRILAPMLVLLALQFFPAGRRWKLLPACMVSPAILLVSLASAIRLARHLALGG
jgi:hypothetical protein